MPGTTSSKKMSYMFVFPANYPEVSACGLATVIEKMRQSEGTTSRALCDVYRHARRAGSICSEFHATVFGGRLAGDSTYCTSIRNRHSKWPRAPVRHSDADENTDTTVSVTSACRTMIKLGSSQRQSRLRTIESAVRGRSELNVCAQNPIPGASNLVGSATRVCVLRRVRPVADGCEPSGGGWGGPSGPFD